jgi:hypothetical protein
MPSFNLKSLSCRVTSNYSSSKDGSEINYRGPWSQELCSSTICYSHKNIHQTVFCSVVLNKRLLDAQFWYAKLEMSGH